MTEGEISKLVQVVVARNSAMVRDRGPDAFSPLMGELMKEARGRADGALVGRTLRRILDDTIEANKKSR